MLAKRFKQMRKLAKVLATPSYRSAFRRAGVAAAIEHEPLLKTLEFASVVDIGANRGQFSLVARHCYPAARIMAFEPLTAPADRFRVALGADSLVTLQRLAIGPAPGSAAMHVAAEDDSSSLLPITSLQQSLFAGSREVATQTVQVECLANCIQEADLNSPALLKIDVQGFELPVLEGCLALLPKFSHVYVECSFVELYAGQALAADVVRWLGEHRFGLGGVYNACYCPDGSAVQADLLFSRLVGLSQT
jgi:FkbM family methyltransferase